MSQAYRDTSLSGDSRAMLGNIYNSTHSSTTYHGVAQSQSNERERHDTHQELIIAAAADGLSVRLRVLLSQGFEVDYKDRYGMTALHRAALNGYEDSVEELISKGWNVNHYSHRFGDPLYIAKAFGRDAVIEVFSRNRGRVRERAGSLVTPLAMAEELNDKELQERFSASTAAHKPSLPDVQSSGPIPPNPGTQTTDSPATVSPPGLTSERLPANVPVQPLQGSPSQVPSPPASTPANETSTHVGPMGPASPASNQELPNGPLPPTPSASCPTGLGLGLQATESNLDLLSLTDSIDHPTPSIAPSDDSSSRRHSTSTGLTSLSSTSKPSKYTTHSPRLASSIKMNIRDSEGTALRTAAAEGKIHMVRALLEKGAPIDNSGVWDGYTALADAAVHGQEEVVRLLLSQGANPAFKCLSSTSKFGSKTNTPLSLAAGKGHLGCMNLLFEYCQYDREQLDEAYRAAKYRNRRDAMVLIQERGGGLS